MKLKITCKNCGHTYTHEDHPMTASDFEDMDESEKDVCLKCGSNSIVYEDIA